MPLGRKTYDGSLVRRSSGDSEWGNPISNKIQVNESVATKRTKNAKSRLKTDDTFFQEEHDKDRYLITYADLITLLLGLFIILYTISNVDAGKYKEVMNAFGSVFSTQKTIQGLGSQNHPFNGNANSGKTLRETLQSVIDEYDYGQNVQLVENERGITIRILDNILFNTGEAKLNPGSKSILSKLAKVLRTIPNDIRIEGHTDNVPINTPKYPSNWHLSVARATNTAYYLMNTEGLSPERVTIVGYAEYKPIASNDTPAGRAQNRRVDIIILNR